MTTNEHGVGCVVVLRSVQNEAQPVATGFWKL
jgi:hypothetical protein